MTSLPLAISRPGILARPRTPADPSGLRGSAAPLHPFWQAICAISGFKPRRQSLPFFLLPFLWLFALGAFVPASLEAAPVLHVGSRDTYTGTADTARVPLLLTNFSFSKISSFKVTVQYPRDSLLYQGFAVTDSAWAVTTREPTFGQVELTLTHKSGGLGFERLFPLDLRFKATSLLANGRNTAIRLLPSGAGAGIGYEGETVRILRSAPSSFGDIDWNGKVDMDDAQGLFDMMVEGIIPDSVSLRGDIAKTLIFRPTLLDVALLYRHALGHQPSLRVETDPWQLSSQATLNVQAPMAYPGGSSFQYKVRARNMSKLLGASIVFQLDPAVVVGIKNVRIHYPLGALYHFSTVPKNTATIRLAFPVPADSNDFDLLTLEVIHQPGQTRSGISFASGASQFNENLRLGGATPVRVQTFSLPGPGPQSGPDIATLGPPSIRLSIAHGPDGRQGWRFDGPRPQRTRVRLFRQNGGIIFSESVTARPGVFQGLPVLPRGAYLLEVALPEGPPLRRSFSALD